MKTIHVRFTEPTSGGYGSETKITQIKALRTATGCGLKAAKDAVEASYSTKGFVSIELEPGETDEQDRNRKVGMIDLRAMETVTVTTSGEDVLGNLNTLVRHATSKGAYDLAIDLLEVLKRHDV